jgi:hypothetical protein
LITAAGARTALRLDPNFVPALVNLADLERTLAKDEEGADLLKQAMALEPDNADGRYALRTRVTPMSMRSH